MSQYPTSQNGTTPSLYADCIWKTSLLPASINGGANPLKPTVTPSANGIEYGFVDPENEAQFITNINITMSLEYYGAGSGYDCLTAVRPCRYVVMHSATPPPGTYSQQAHQLLVNADGSYTYIDTKWTS